MDPLTVTVADRDFQLRRAGRQDLAQIVALLADDPLRRAAYGGDLGSEDKYVTAFHTITADPQQALMVLVDDGQQVVGTMQLTFLAGLSRAASTRLLIEAVRVAATLRGLGLGTVMLEWAAEEGRRRGASLIQLTSDGSRRDAHRFYERLGYAASHVGFKLFL